MVFKRTGARTYAFQARLPNGRYKQLQTGAPFTAAGKALAQRIDAMWSSLALEHRAWDLLEPVLTACRHERTFRLGRLYDLWLETKYNPNAMRRRLDDRDLEPLVAEWGTWYAGEVKADSAAHALTHVRHLLPVGTPRLVSDVTTAWLTQALTAYPGKRNTRRKVHSSWSRLFDYLTSVRGLFLANPMDAVPRPAEEASPIRFYELDTVERIVGWQPTPQRRAAFALAYGAAIEASVLVALTRRQFFDTGAKLVRAAGTKAHTRDRVCRVADWAWPHVWEHLRDLLPDAPLFPGWNRWTLSDWHRETVGWNEESEVGLNLPARYPLHAARDHWAVMRLRSGAPIAVVQLQLGHESPTLTLKKYGRFIPSGQDRDQVEQAVTAYETRRRQTR
jgi:integrase